MARAAELQRRLAEGQRAWDEQKDAEHQVLLRGKESFDETIRIVLAVGEAAQQKYLARIDELVGLAKGFASEELAIPRSEVDHLVDGDFAEFGDAVRQHGRTLGVLMLLKAARQIASNGMEYCARTTLLFHQIMTTGLSDPTTPIRVAVRDFLEARPLFQQQNELGQTVDVYVTPADIDRRFTEWAARSSERPTGSE